MTPRGGAKPKLWEGDWPAKVVGLEGLPKLPASQPAVVVVRTSAAQFEAELWARDREAIAGTTVVLLGEGTDPCPFTPPKDLWQAPPRRTASERILQGARR